MRVSGGHLCIYAEAPTEPTGETALPYKFVLIKHSIINKTDSLFSLISSLNKRNYTLVAISIHRNTILYKSKNIQLTAKNNTVLPTH